MSDLPTPEPGDDELRAIKTAEYDRSDAERVPITNYELDRAIWRSGFRAGVATHNTTFRCLNDEFCGIHDGIYLHSVRCGLAEAKFAEALLVPTSKEGGN